MRVVASRGSWITTCHTHLLNGHRYCKCNCNDRPWSTPSVVEITWRIIIIIIPNCYCDWMAYKETWGLLSVCRRCKVFANINATLYFLTRLFLSSFTQTTLFLYISFQNFNQELSFWMAEEWQTGFHSYAWRLANVPDRLATGCVKFSSGNKRGGWLDNGGWQW